MSNTTAIYLLMFLSCLVGFTLGYSGGYGLGQTDCFESHQ